MTTFQAQLTKEWRLHKSVALDSMIAAVLGCLLLPLDGGLGILVLGGLAALRIGTRLGSDLGAVDTWEFLLTRPIDRRAFVRERMALGLVPVFGVCVVVLVLDAVDAHAWFAHLFVERAPWLDAAPQAIGERSWLTLPFIFLVYALGFERGLARGGTDQAQSAAFEAGVIALVIALVIGVITAIVFQLLAPLIARRENPTQILSGHWPTTTLSLGLVIAIGVLTCRRSEFVVARKQIVAHDARTQRSAAFVWLLVAAIVVLALGFLFMGVSRMDMPSNVGGR